MAAAQENSNPVTGNPTVYASCFTDRSEPSHANDHSSSSNGVVEVKEAADILRTAGIPCCLVAEPALIYYGARRMMNDWVFCIPTHKIEIAATLFQSRPDHFQDSKPSGLSYPGRLDKLYPRFKFVGRQISFIIMTSQACHLEPNAENVELSNAGLPYPTLPAYAQSLLDGKMDVDLDDLIDGMSLTLEWGEENLDLEGVVDANWIWWRMNAAYGLDANSEKPPWYGNPDKRRDIWINKVASESKKVRQGWKYQEDHETRFRKFDSQNPRSH